MRPGWIAYHVKYTDHGVALFLVAVPRKLHAAPPAECMGDGTTVHEYVIRRNLLEPGTETDFAVTSAYRVGSEFEDADLWEVASWTVSVFETGPRHWEITVEQPWADWSQLPTILTHIGYDPDCHDYGRLEAMAVGELPLDVRLAAWQHLLEDRQCRLSE